MFNLILSWFLSFSRQRFKIVFFKLFVKQLDSFLIIGVKILFIITCFNNCNKNLFNLQVERQLLLSGSFVTFSINFVWKPNRFVRRTTNKEGQRYSSVWRWVICWKKLLDTKISTARHCSSRCQKNGNCSNCNCSTKAFKNVNSSNYKKMKV